MRPADAKTEADIRRLASDNHPANADAWSILMSKPGSVSLHFPQGGGWVEIPADQFRDIAEWFLRDQPESQQ